MQINIWGQWVKELRNVWRAEFDSDLVLQEFWTWFSQMKFISMKTNWESIECDTRAYAIMFHFVSFHFAPSFCFSILWSSFFPGSTALGGKPFLISYWTPSVPQQEDWYLSTLSPLPSQFHRHQKHHCGWGKPFRCSHTRRAALVASSPALQKQWYPDTTRPYLLHCQQMSIRHTWRWTINELISKELYSGKSGFMPGAEVNSLIT